MRKAFRMSLHAGQEAEYIRRHQPIWQDLERTLLEHGVQTYSIFLDRTTNHLFGYVEFESEQQWNAVAATDVCQRWWKYMQDLMPITARSASRSRKSFTSRSDTAAARSSLLGFCRAAVLRPRPTP